MKNLITVYSSNIPIDCHIIKGRLETEGISCFIYDENLLWVHPFMAVAIGGVKLKVKKEKYTQSQKIINLILQDKLIDENGEYTMSEILNNEINRQNEILLIKSKIRKNTSLLDKNVFQDSKFIDPIEIEKTLNNEREFQKLSKKRFKFSWEQFFYELFDFERSIFKYFRTKSVDYYIEKEIVENYINQKDRKESINCPKCNSENTAHGYAIDKKWDVLYIILSLLIVSLFFPIRKKHHCFDCGYDFKKKENN